MAKTIPLSVREHMAALGKKGGSVKSPKKAWHSRRNGRLAARLYKQKAD